MLSRCSSVCGTHPKMLTVLCKIFWTCVSSLLSYLLYLFFCFVLPVTWMTVRSLKFQRTAWTKEQSRSGPNALSCWKFWEKVAMGRWGLKTLKSTFLSDTFSLLLLLTPLDLKVRVWKGLTYIFIFICIWCSVNLKTKKTPLFLKSCKMQLIFLSLGPGVSMCGRHCRCLEIPVGGMGNLAIVYSVIVVYQQPSNSHKYLAIFFLW